MDYETSMALIDSRFIVLALFLQKGLILNIEILCYALFSIMAILQEFKILLRNIFLNSTLPYVCNLIRFPLTILQDDRDFFHGVLNEFKCKLNHLLTYVAIWRISIHLLLNHPLSRSYKDGF